MVSENSLSLLLIGLYKNQGLDTTTLGDHFNAKDVGHIQSGYATIQSQLKPN